MLNLGLGFDGSQGNARSLRFVGYKLKVTDSNRLEVTKSGSQTFLAYFSKVSLQMNQKVSELRRYSEAQTLISSMSDVASIRPPAASNRPCQRREPIDKCAPIDLLLKMSF